ncbi:GtrA family protein [Salipaludibacillus sp. CF4.18]|uniref:GtrA family protein n=1 Tax=Salipaludibacillus sp. CF4.18 TaxID=3373081 RepID=UPI003EE55577
MEKVMKQTNREFIRFIVVGIINTFHYYVSYLLLHGIFGINYMVAHIAGFLISFVISFYLNSLFTFKVKPTLVKFLQFPVTQLFNITVSSLCVYIFIEQFQMESTTAPILSIFITIPLTFIVTGKILKK